MGDGHLRIQPSHRSGCHATYVSTQAPIQPQPHNIISLWKVFVVSLPSDLQPRTTHDTPPHSEAPTTDHTYTQITRANSPIERRGHENPPDKSSHHASGYAPRGRVQARPIQGKQSRCDTILSPVNLVAEEEQEHVWGTAGEDLSRSLTRQVKWDTTKCIRLVFPTTEAPDDRPTDRTNEWVNRCRSRAAFSERKSVIKGRLSAMVVNILARVGDDW